MSWVIGPEVQESWSTANPALTDDALSSTGAATTASLAEACVANAALEAAARQALGQRYYLRNPLDDPAWAAMADAQTPQPLNSSMPLYLGQSTSDDVVLAWPNAVLQRQWCQAGTDLTAAWISGVSHMQTGLVMGPGAVDWLTARLTGAPTTSTCSIPPPVSEPTS